MLKVSCKKEIACVFIIKLILLFGLWKICFSHPIDRNLTSALVADHLINSTKENPRHD